VTHKSHYSIVLQFSASCKPLDLRTDSRRASETDCCLRAEIDAGGFGTLTTHGAAKCSEIVPWWKLN
jgi:hypothetical protein